MFTKIFARVAYERQDVLDHLISSDVTCMGIMMMACINNYRKMGDNTVIDYISLSVITSFLNGLPQCHDAEITQQKL